MREPDIKALECFQVEYRGERLNYDQVNERYGDELASYAVSVNFFG